jgi:hypothetical protein
MGEMTNFGTKAGLKDGPRNMEPSNHSQGTRQDFGTKAPLSSTPASNKFHTGGGEMQKTGTQAPLASKASKGYHSASTPMSARSLKQGQ